MRISAKNALFLMFLAGAAGALLWFAPHKEAQVSQKPRVAATIFPLYDIVRTIAGSAVDVTLILPPGAEPHSYEPTPSVVREVADAEAVYTIGHGLDAWIAPILAATTADTVIVDRGITLRRITKATPLGGSGDSAAPSAAADDPHYWLTVPNAQRIAETVTDDLIARFPADTAVFRANYAAFADQLRALDIGIRAKIPQGKRIVTFHDAWYYFADEYGVRIVGTFEPAPGREPTARSLAALRAAIAETGTSVIYAEPLFSRSAIASFAIDSAIRIATLDDIGGTPGKESYIALMNANADAIAETK